MAAKNGNLDAVKMLLDEGGAAVEEPVETRPNGSRGRRCDNPVTIAAGGSYNMKLSKEETQYRRDGGMLRPGP